VYYAVVQERFDVSVKYPASASDALVGTLEYSRGIDFCLMLADLACVELVQERLFVSVKYPASRLFRCISASLCVR
jgi:hypothetical protein